jgi:Mce-associated membrane protein
VTSADDALAAAEEADAEAAEAEAVAAAARARARAIRLRREAAAAAAETTASVAATAKADAPAAEAEQPADTGRVATGDDVSETELTDAADDAEPPAVDELADEDDTAAEDLDDDLEDDDLDDEDPDVPAPAAWKVIAKALVASVALVGSIALLGLSVAIYVHHRHVETQQSQTAEFAAAARQGVVTLMSLDFNKAEEDVQRIIDNTTGDFKKDFQSQSEDFIKVAQASKVVTEANVNAVAVQSMSDNDATVLVAVTTNVSNTAAKQQEPRSWRLKVGVTREGDQIKLSKVEFVP